MPRYAAQIGSTLTGLRRTHAADLGNVGLRDAEGKAAGITSEANQLAQEIIASAERTAKEAEREAASTKLQAISEVEGKAAGIISEAEQLAQDILAHISQISRVGAS